MAPPVPKPGQYPSANPAAADSIVQRLRGPIAWLALVGMAGLGIYDEALFAFGLAALVPAAAAWFLDRTPTMVLTRTVIPLNLSCVVPLGIQVYYADNQDQRLTDMMENTWVWITIYAASGVGYLLYYFLPRIIAIYISLRTESRRKDLLQKQEELRLEWGGEVNG